jgi:hypothetical protein
VRKDQRLGATWGLGGFVLGAVFSAAVLSALGHQLALTSTPPLNSPMDTPPAGAASQAAASPRLMLFAVKRHEVMGAIETMELPTSQQRIVLGNVANQKYRLLWLTLWDWDAQISGGEAISITSDNYHRLFTLGDKRTKIAIPEPKSGFIELRGEHAEDGITVSLLSGAQPLAMPRMSVGQTIKIEIDAR